MLSPQTPGSPTTLSGDLQIENCSHNTTTLIFALVVHKLRWEKSLRPVRLFATPWTIYSPWNSPGQNTGLGSLSLLQGIVPTQGSKPRSPTLQSDSLPAEPQGKPKNTGVGSLSLLQGVFPTHESDLDLLHCRRIIYQLSYKGSPQSKR